MNSEPRLGVFTDAFILDMSKESANINAGYYHIHSITLHINCAEEIKLQHHIVDVLSMGNPCGYVREGAQQS